MPIKFNPNDFSDKLIVSTLNSLAYGIQQDTRNKLPSWLKLTRPAWMKSSVIYTKATTSAPFATVGFNKDKAPLANLMEVGGTRTPETTKTIPVPVDVRRTGKGGVSFTNRPFNLITSKKAFINKIGNTLGVWAKEGKSGVLKLLWVLRRSTTYTKQFTHFRSNAQDFTKANLQKIAKDQFTRMKTK